MAFQLIIIDLNSTDCFVTISMSNIVSLQGNYPAAAAAADSSVQFSPPGALTSDRSVGGSPDLSESEG